jgi:hypothetical protein
MRIGSDLCPPLARRRRVRQRPLPVELLDRRELLSTIPSPVTVLSATTVASKSVTVSYDLTGPDPSLDFGVYRSAVAQFDATAIPVASPLAVPAVDDSGLSSTALGVHQLTIPLADGLPINPKHPYVVVVADPDSPSATDPGESASFRKVVIGIVTHGGLEDSAWDEDGPPWERQMANSLREQGYDFVIPYNWVAQSSTPGEAAKQGPILAKMILDAAAKVPANEPIDLQFIGHSEGAVVNTLAIEGVEAKAPPQIKAGFLEDTLLDPHAANPDFPGKQYSVADNPLGTIAKLAIDNYQARSRDPLVTIPAGVDAAQVFYQQTPASRDHNLNLGIYNLWGQVPIPGASVYFNLTSDNIVHSGKNSVYAWYEHNVVPTLGDGGQTIARETLTGTLNAPTQPGGHTVDTPRATYSGTSAPGSTVELLASKAGPGRLEVVGHVTTATDGTWTASTRPLADGSYRVVAQAILPKTYKGELTPVPTAALGLLVVKG